MEQKKSSIEAQTIVLVTIVILGSCLGSLSQTALNAMFSGMAADFGIEANLGQWATTLYMLVMGITVPVVTYLMRKFSLKRLTLGALGFLLVGGIVDIFAVNFPMLLVGRTLQAISGGITVPMMLSVVMMSFPPGQQGTVMGIAGIALGFAPNIGPTIGGWMLESFGWRSFFVALSVVSAVLIVVAALCLRLMPASQANARLDGRSLLYSALGFGGLLLGLSNASSFSLTSWFIWAPIVVGALFLVVFMRRQRQVPNPLINLDIFKSSRYRISFWAGNFLYASFMGITLVVPLYVEGVLGYNAFIAGMALLPGTIAAFIFNPLSGYLTDKIGVRPVVLVASLFLATGATLAAVCLNESTPFWVVVVTQAFRSTGVSGLISPLTSWGLSKLPGNLVTDGSSFNTTVRQAFASFGTALMIFAITAGTAAGSVVWGYHFAFGCSALFAIALVVTAVVRIR